MSLLSANERAELLLDSMIADLKEQRKFNTEYAKGRIYELEVTLNCFERVSTKSLYNSLVTDYKLLDKDLSEYLKGRRFQMSIIIQSLLIYFPELKKMIQNNEIEENIIRQILPVIELLNELRDHNPDNEILLKAYISLTLLKDTDNNYIISKYK